MAQQTIIKKLPLPMINVEQVIPADEKDRKCGPHLSFDNGSCIPLNLLIKMAKAYNQYNNNNSINDIIKLDDTMDTLYPNEYKRFLLFEFQERFKNSNQSKWIKKKFIELMSTEDKEYLEYDVFRPEGPQGKFEWLSTLDINKTLAQYENKYPDFQFLGAVPIDFNDLDYYPFKTMDFNNFIKEKKTRIGIIFNLDEHYKGGSHWVSLFCDLSNGQVYFSDSYGSRPEKRISDFITRIKNYFEKSNIPNIDIRHNQTQHQKGNSECGVYSINFILRLLKGKTFDHITRKRLTDEKVNKCRLRYFK